jgi:hypothetical protein
MDISSNSNNQVNLESRIVSTCRGWLEPFQLLSPHQQRGTTMAMDRYNVFSIFDLIH